MQRGGCCEPTPNRSSGMRIQDSRWTGMESASFTCTLLSGGFAGTSVDVALFPLDTIKTRLQAPKGFLASGGFRGVYNGIGAAAGGSAPGAAMFFCTYEAVKAVCIALPALPELPVLPALPQ